MTTKAVTAISSTPWGIEVRAVEIEVTAGSAGGWTVMGMSERAGRELQLRVIAALSAIDAGGWAERSVSVNLRPFDLAQRGRHLDLGVALAVLGLDDPQLAGALVDRLVAGELDFSGTVRAIRGQLAVADVARRLGLREVLLPCDGATEAATVDGLRVIPVPDLRQAIDYLRGGHSIRPAKLKLLETRREAAPDLSEIRGQEGAKRALEVAAAGGHSLLFIGPPGSGKTMLARTLPGLLPPMTRQEAIEVAKVHSWVLSRPPEGLVMVRPFRSPPAVSTSASGLVGGGTVPRPGEVSLAHNGVLFLDEVTAFEPQALAALRQPLEEGLVTVVRPTARSTFPAQVMLVAAMVPCPCGHLGDPRHDCGCTPSEVDRFRRRLARPLLDRIDLHVEVHAVGLAELRDAPGERSKPVAERIAAARAIQQQRFGDGHPSPVNAAMGPGELACYAHRDEPGQKLLDTAFERLGLSARALHRISRLSRTVADLAGSDEICAPHVAEAIQYRTLDRRTSTNHT